MLHFILFVDQKCLDPSERCKHPYCLIDNQTVINGDLAFTFLGGWFTGNPFN